MKPLIDVYSPLLSDEPAPHRIATLPAPKPAPVSRVGLCENAFRDPVHGWSRMTYCTRPATTVGRASRRPICQECADATRARIEEWAAGVWAFWVAEARANGCEYCDATEVVAIIPPRHRGGGICATCIPDANEVGIIPGLIDMEGTP